MCESVWTLFPEEMLRDIRSTRVVSVFYFFGGSTVKLVFIQRARGRERNDCGRKKKTTTRRRRKKIIK